MATKEKNQTDTATQVDTEATEAQSAQDELSELESSYKERRKELRATVRDEGKAAIIEAGTNLANDLYEALIDIATQAGQKINRFTIRLVDGKAEIKSAVVRLPKNEDAVTTVEPDPEKQAAVKQAAADKKSGK